MSTPALRLSTSQSVSFDLILRGKLVSIPAKIVSIGLDDSFVQIEWQSSRHQPKRAWRKLDTLRIGCP
jgi:hypothetical protein